MVNCGPIKCEFQEINLLFHEGTAKISKPVNAAFVLFTCYVFIALATETNSCLTAVGRFKCARLIRVYPPFPLGPNSFNFNRVFSSTHALINYMDLLGDLNLYIWEFEESCEYFTRDNFNLTQGTSHEKAKVK